MRGEVICLRSPGVKLGQTGRQAACSAYTGCLHRDFSPEAPLFSPLTISLCRRNQGPNVLCCSGTHARFPGVAKMLLSSCGRSGLSPVESSRMGPMVNLQQLCSTLVCLLNFGSLGFLCFQLPTEQRADRQDWGSVLWLSLSSHSLMPFKNQGLILPISATIFYLAYLGQDPKSPWLN